MSGKKKEEVEKKKYPIGPENYELYEEVGQGVSASVHRARCVPFDEVVAIKILDFERDNADLSNISREVQTMILADHVNVLKSHCSFVSDHNLWIVMPFMAGGSCLHILKAAYPDGFEEVVIATILREVLKGLEYLHHHGHIHRDVKAGNILINGRGAIKLGDFGVSACLFDSGDRQRMRNTFVGTPCWMAPEVMEQLHGYDFKADIWSFGITALELAHGHAPFSKYPPMKVLLMTLQNAPPGLDYETDRKFSKSFKQMIASCLVKDPAKRPSAKKLLKHSFFKQGRSSEYIARTLLEGLPSLGDRIKALKRKEEDMLAQKKMPDGQKEEISQNEYKRGISSWNFNLDDVKAQASLIQDIEDPITDGNLGGSSTSLSTLDVPEKKLECQMSEIQYTELEDNDLMQNQSVSFPTVDSTVNGTKVKCKGPDDDSSIASSSQKQHTPLDSALCQDDKAELCTVEVPATEINGKAGASYLQHKPGGQLDNSNLPEIAVPVIKGESEKSQRQQHNNSSKNGGTIALDPNDFPSEILPKVSKSSAATSDESDEKAKQPVVQQRGRFKVTSENLDAEKVPHPILQKSYSMQVGSVEVLSLLSIKQGLAQNPGISFPPPSESILSTLSGFSLFPQLHSVLQANIVQRESILNIMKQILNGETSANRATDGGLTIMQVVAAEKLMLEAAHDREKELLREITDMQLRPISPQDDGQKGKTENVQA